MKYGTEVWDEYARVMGAQKMIKEAGAQEQSKEEVKVEKACTECEEEKEIGTIQNKLLEIADKLEAKGLGEQAGVIYDVLGIKVAVVKIEDVKDEIEYVLESIEGKPKFDKGLVKKIVKLVDKFREEKEKGKEKKEE